MPKLVKVLKLTMPYKTKTDLRLWEQTIQMLESIQDITVEDITEVIEAVYAGNAPQGISNRWLGGKRA
jgi:hypothetical protein